MFLDKQSHILFISVAIQDFPTICREQSQVSPAKAGISQSQKVSEACHSVCLSHRNLLEETFPPGTSLIQMLSASVHVELLSP
jgi:hypothetical protein